MKQSKLRVSVEDLHQLIADEGLGTIAYQLTLNDLIIHTESMLKAQPGLMYSRRLKSLCKRIDDLDYYNFMELRSFFIDNYRKDMK